MRSQSVAAFLAAHGYEAYTLEGGYKAFRNWAENVLERPQKICAIAGATGSGKTEVLWELQRVGFQVVDLEALACHKGSVFGHLGEKPQPSSEHFRNLVGTAWAALDTERFVFVEDEGPRIGGVSLPASLYRRLRKAQLVVRLDVPFELRVERSLATYGPFGVEALSDAVSKFRARMGSGQTEHLLGLLARGELRPVCEEALRQYDSAYGRHLLRARDPGDIVSVAASRDAAAAARAVAAAAAPHEPTARAVAGPPPQGAQPRQASVPLQAGVPGANDTEASSAEAASGEALREARCHCGAVVVRVRGEPMAVSVCHCSTCRKLSGAPFVASALFEPGCVEVAAVAGGEARLAETRTSAAVSRRRCAACYAPVAGFLGSRYIAVPLALFDWAGRPPPPAWLPQHHLHYESRVMDVDDGLAKYAGRKGGPLWASRPPETAAE